MEGPKMLSRDLVPMAEGCASLAGIGKPLDEKQCYGDI